MKISCLSVLALAASQMMAPTAATAAAPATAVIERGDAATRREVVAAVEAWRTALIKADRAGLERAYHDDLSYGHTDGAVLTKQQQIDRTLVPNRVFPAVDIEGLAVRSYGNVAYVTATWTFHSKKADGTESASRLSGLDVWTRGSAGWQLIARQLTRPVQ